MGHARQACGVLFVLCTLALPGLAIPATAPPDGGTGLAGSTGGGASREVSPVPSVIITANDPRVLAFERTGTPVAPVAGEMGLPATPEDIRNISLPDAVYWNTSLAKIDGVNDTQVFQIRVDDEVRRAAGIVFRWTGYGETEPKFATNLSVWDSLADRWVLLDTTEFQETKNKELRGDLTQALGRYTADGNLTFMVQSLKGRSKSSCPLLYTWDGERFRFVNDFLGPSIINYPMSPSIRKFPPDYDEYLAIPGELLKERDGRYVLQVTEELEEVTFLDQLRLLVVDHPADTVVTSDDGFHWAPPFPSGQRWVLSDVRPLVGASDGSGQDVLPELLEADRRYPPVPRLPYEGFAERHELLLDLGDLRDTEHPVLIVTGSIRYPYTYYGDFEAFRNGATLELPTVEVADGAGGWIALGGEMGFPGGVMKTFGYDLGGRFPTDDHRIRISTSMVLFYDQILVGDLEQGTPQRETVLDPVSADLHDRGWSVWSSPDGQHPYLADYDTVVHEAPWATHAGAYTRYGDVRELLTAVDDRWLVLNTGDEVTVAFPASAPALPAGWRRDFFLYANGTHKEMDTVSDVSRTVDPLPFHAMTDYPPPAGESYPTDAVHQDYLRTYQTRYLDNAGGPVPYADRHRSLWTDDVRVELYLPVGELLIDPGACFRVARSTLAIGGTLTISNGACLRLDHAVLAMTSPTGGLVRVRPGGLLELTNGSLLTDGEADTDDGSVLDARTHVTVEAGARLVIRDSAVEEVGVETLPPYAAGFHLAADGAVVTNATFRRGGRGIVLDGVAGGWFENITFEGIRGAEVHLLNGSRIDLRNAAFTNLSMTNDSWLRVWHTVDVVVEDQRGMLLRDVEIRVERVGRAVYASGGFGGRDARTAGYDLLGRAQPTWASAPHRVYDGTMAPVKNATRFTVQYGGASLARFEETAVAGKVRFVLADLTTARFTDVAAAAGVADPTEPASALDSRGPGGAWGDMDGDGDLDLYTTGAATVGEWEKSRVRPPHRLWRNEGNGRFSDVTAASGAGGTGAYGASWVDIDEDGDQDLYLSEIGWAGDYSEPGEPNVLLLNDGTGRFVPAGNGTGLADPGHSFSTSWADYDRDGLVDAYVANQGVLRRDVDGIANETNVLYANRGDGVFTDATRRRGAVQTGNITGGGVSGLGSQERLVRHGAYWVGTRWLDSPAGSGISSGAVWFDADGDRDDDLYVLNDLGVSVFYRNEGGGRFTQRTAAAGLAAVGGARGGAVGDVDRDGDLDLFVTDYHRDRLWINDGRGFFQDRAGTSGVANGFVGWGTCLFDMDNDGDLDLFVATAAIHPEKPSDALFLYRQDAGGRFTDVSGSAGLSMRGRFTGAACADYDADGRQDIWVGRADGPDVLLHNDGPAPGHWLALRLTGSVSNRDAFGAFVTVRTANRTQVAERISTSGYLGQNGPDVWFGLGPDALVERLTVEWPSGQVQVLENLTVDRRFDLREPNEVTARAGADRTVLVGTRVRFNASESSGANPRLLTQGMVSWTFANGTTGTTTVVEGLTADVHFARPGRHTVNLTVRDRDGTVGTDQVVIEVTPPPVPPRPAAPLLPLFGLLALLLILGAALAAFWRPASGQGEPGARERRKRRTPRSPGSDRKDGGKPPAKGRGNVRRG